ncbi:hypothetical protein [Blastopirellula marina]|uniref:DUF2802 domain-containing protein n=1 Tax=Blastopirellula marina TaxID=124 RepID=A0A2S8FI53_9BACT|nr:hypothetical protein [Blastopirellula marina]PQO31624.1 hypothetical protein C5Y98_19605 [Blastopirellula marina]PTL42931.1 hypothetical protein C5Y97_19615 [Blastopirellula marina]
MGEEGYAPYLMFFGGLILLIWLLMRRNWQGQRRAKKERGKDDYLARNPRPVSKEWTMSDGPRELNQWQVEMLERTRELQALVDTKLLILQRTLLKVKEAELSDQERAAIEPVVRESQALADQGAPNFAAVSELLCDEAKKIEVYEMANAGSTPEEIAAKLDLDPYAVEMVLGLRET